MTTRERKEARIARRLEWAEKRQSQGERTLSHAMDGLPDNGQPILIGHHSEKRHRNAIDRANNAMRRGCDDLKMAEHHRSLADGIAAQLDSSIYSDDENAVEALAERIAGLEAERDRYKTQNAACRKRKGQPVEAAFAEMIQAGIFTEAEAKDLIFACSCFRGDPLRGWPSYKLSNLSGNISRNQKRLDALSGAQKRVQRFILWEPNERYSTTKSAHGFPSVASARRYADELTKKHPETVWEVREVSGMHEASRWADESYIREKQGLPPLPGAPGTLVK